MNTINWKSLNDTQISTGDRFNAWARNGAQAQRLAYKVDLEGAKKACAIHASAESGSHYTIDIWGYDDSDALTGFVVAEPGTAPSEQ